MKRCIYRSCRKTRHPVLESCILYWLHV